MKRWSRELDDPYTTKLLNVSLVRPSMEYCSCISTSQISCYQNMLESVQKQLLLFALRGLNWDTGCEVAPAGLTNPVPSELQNTTSKFKNSLFCIPTLPSVSHKGHSVITHSRVLMYADDVKLCLQYKDTSCQSN